MVQVRSAATLSVESLTESRWAATWPVVFTVATLWAGIGSLLSVSLRDTAGRLVYALDDPYIHMAIAQNVARHGVWGVSHTHFTSSSSSLLWTMLVAGCFAVFGVHDVIPLLLNVIFATGLIALASYLFRQLYPAVSSVYQCVLLTVVAFVAPLPALVFVGQEHILHATLTLAFTFEAAWFLAKDASGAQQHFKRLVALAFLLPVVRYESIFLVLIASILCASRRRWRQCILLLAAAAIPVAVYGAISLSLGWYWLPNSVLLKGNRPSAASLSMFADSIGYAAYSRLMHIPALALLFSSALVLLIARIAKGLFDVQYWLLLIFASITVLHLQYAQPASFWMFRYEAYLLILGIFVVGAAAAEWWGTLQSAGENGWLRRYATVAIAIVLVLFSPLTERAVRALTITSQATKNVFDQQYQMGLFLRTFYTGSAVAMNDIGAASYLADIECLDLMGLANMEVASRVVNGWYFDDDIQEIVDSKGVVIAVVYESWFRGRIPPKWRKAGSWTIHGNVVNGGDTVSFYATHAQDWGQLRMNLRDFSRRLPPDVTAKIE